MLFTAIGVLCCSYHLNRAPNYNEINPGVYVTIEKTLDIGIYKDSYRKWNPFVAYEKEVVPNFGVVIGYAAKYKHPLTGGVYVDIPTYNLRVLASPTYEEHKISGLVVLSFRKTF